MTDRQHRGRAESKRQAEQMCQRLRERGDELSMDAANEIEGTLDCFDKIASDNCDLRERVAQLRRNHDSLNRLWSRVPVAARLRAAHGGSHD